MPFASKTFTGNGTWTAPSGVTLAILVGWGGGGGGGSGSSSSGGNGPGGGGGGGAIESTIAVTVVPNTAYSVTIGGGGTGGTGVTSSPGVNGNNGNNGTDTTFGALATFRAASGGQAGIVLTTTMVGGGLAVTANGNTQLVTQAQASPNNNLLNAQTNIANSESCGGGASGTGIGVAGGPGVRNAAGGDGGAGGGAASASGGGGGGGGGPGGAGTAGTAGSATAGTSTASNAAANSGAGGGGSGASTFAGTTGNGGNGGSGQVTVIWWE